MGLAVAGQNWPLNTPELVWEHPETGAGSATPASRTGAPGRFLERCQQNVLGFRVYTFTPLREGLVRAPWWRQSASFTWTA